MENGIGYEFRCCSWYRCLDLSGFVMVRHCEIKPRPPAFGENDKNESRNRVLKLLIISL
jgi:hypothetical protein